MIEQKVFLEPIKHIYTDNNGVEYKSVSKLIELVKPKFDRENISKAVAKKRGISQEEVLAEWDKKRDDAANHGTNIHNNLEYYEKYGKSQEGSEDLSPIMQSILSEYSGYKKVYQELCIYNEEFKIAGTSDKVMVKSLHKDAPIHLADYKTNVQKGIVFDSEYNKYLSYPLSHLQDVNFNHYSLQLSIYAYMLELLTKRRIGTLNIHYIPFENPLSHRLIPVNYLRTDVINLFNHYGKLKKEYELENEECESENIIEGEPSF